MKYTSELFDRVHIDIIIERKIQDTIQDSFTESTVITIAHRMNTIMHCDRILVMDSGKVS